jgi:deoxyuridine 5'-triphosphate nucleotidohydrolase
MTLSEAEAYQRGVRLAQGRAAAESPTENLEVHAARGIFDTLGVIADLNASELSCRLDLTRQPELTTAFSEGFRAERPAPLRPELQWHGHEALDFLATLYDDAEVFAERNCQLYRAWAARVPILTARPPALGELEWCALRPDAVAPRKERASDSGYDLTLLEKLKQLGEVELYGTGVQVRPPFGFYFDVVPRSSIIKRGYLLANSVGVIDRGYRGEIMVPLVRTSEHTEPLELPARVVQLVPRPIVHFRVRQRPSLDTTGRGSGGFGSTGR